MSPTRYNPDGPRPLLGAVTFDGGHTCGLCGARLPTLPAAQVHVWTCGSTLDIPADPTGVDCWERYESPGGEGGS